MRSDGRGSYINNSSSHSVSSSATRISRFARDNRERAVDGLLLRTAAASWDANPSQY